MAAREARRAGRATPVSLVLVVVAMVGTVVGQLLGEPDRVSWVIIAAAVVVLLVAAVALARTLRRSRPPG